MSTTTRASDASTYRSAVDTWLWIALGASIVIVGATCVPLAVFGSGTPRAVAVAGGLLGAGLPLWILTSTSYTLTATELLVRSGPFRWRRALAEITAIQPTRNPLSSPALSLDRLRIETRGRAALMISPADRAAFLADLEARRAAAGRARR